MKKQFLLLIFGLAFASVLAAKEEVEYGDCPDDMAKSCLKLDKLSKCCGTKGNICCSADEYYSQFPNLEDDAKAEPRGLLRGIAKLIGFIVGAVIFVVVVCCVCCFCCPFCLFSKHRNGRVIRRNDQAQEQQQQQQQPQQIVQAVPMQPNPPTGYPPQQAYPNQACYPPAPQPGYGYPPQPGVDIPPYPDNPPPYPGPPLTQAPPLQTKENASYEQQPAYNPNL